MIRRPEKSSPRAAAARAPFALLLLTWVSLPAARAQQPETVDPAAPLATPAPSLDLNATPAPMDPSSPTLPPLINAPPLGAPGAPAGNRVPALTPEATSTLDSEYRRATAVQIPITRAAGRPLSLIEAVRLTLSQNPQIQLSREDANLSRSFYQQSTGVFDARFTSSGSIGRTSDERTPAQLRQDRQTRNTKQQLVNQFLSARDQLQADLNRSIATNTAPNQSVGNNVGNVQNGQSNGAISNGTFVFLDQATQNLQNQQQSFNTQFTDLITQIAKQNATPEQVNQLVTLQNGINDVARQQEALTIQVYDRVAKDLLTDLRKNGLQTSQESNATSYSVGLNKLFRNGVTIQPLVSFQRQGFGRGLPNNRGRVGVTVNVPLLRNYGVDATGATETASKIDYEASQLSLRHSVSLNVYQTTLLYWNVVAAQRRVDLLRQSQRVAGTLLDLSRTLIKADELAPAEIFVIAARANDTAIQADTAELQLLDLQQQLAVQVGVDPGRIAVPLSPTDGFPARVSTGFIRGLPREPLLRTAEELRADLNAARKLQVSGKVLARAAQLNLKPRLDFQLNTSFSTIDDGSHANKYLNTFTSNYTGPSVLGSLVLDWPLANNTQRGQLNQARATLQQRVIQTTNLQRIIGSSVVFSLGSVENALLQLDEANAASGNYRRALDAEYDKLKAGSSTFLNAVEVEERYTLAGLNVISAQLQYASSLARVRYETGTLMPPTPDATIAYANLTTIPAPVPPIATPAPASLLVRPGAGGK